MIKIIVLFFYVLGLVLCAIGSDDDHKELHEIASKIMNSLQKEHIPSEGSVGSAPNSPLHHLNDIHKNPELIDKTDKTKITVGVKGVKFVSVQRNGKFVNITTDFGIGSVALYSVDRLEDKDLDLNQIELNQALDEENDREIDETLETMEDKYLNECLNAGQNETKVILGQKAKFGINIKQKGSKKDVKIGVKHGYLVAARVNVTKGYSDFYEPY